MIAEYEVSNFESFQDCLSTSIIQRLAPDSGETAKKRQIKGRKNEIKPVAKVKQDVENNDAAELSEFVEYLAEEIFLNMPAELRTLSYAAVQDDAELASRYSVPLGNAEIESLIKPLPLSVPESLTTYGLINDESDLDHFLEPCINSYITTTSEPPAEYTPALTATRPGGCEICDREHVPLTYHHLIPRQVHAKVVKRGWHKEWELNKVAWLCRACHSYVHRVAPNEQLARELYSVDLLLEREDIQRFAKWVGTVRWKAR
ncbi:hypothetical protein DOTSEDRAFT_158617 [Dothistroma septosporum NZE10]|uniref:HNH domain-containing protein n=1 Tax=Dothistroma septosporum (strain NZE10 / CBS 128990) TaxID=675120 RepID=N1PD32_DOTSN|nr:hypothetical protein DOTSEDRAFT_158617 [Dothistroma septosporum NZE10]